MTKCSFCSLSWSASLWITVILYRTCRSECRIHWTGCCVIFSSDDDAILASLLGLHYGTALRASMFSELWTHEVWHLFWTNIENSSFSSAFNQCIVCVAGAHLVLKCALKEPCYSNTLCFCKKQHNHLLSVQQSASCFLSLYKMHCCISTDDHKQCSAANHSNLMNWFISTKVWNMFLIQHIFKIHSEWINVYVPLCSMWIVSQI